MREEGINGRERFGLARFLAVAALLAGGLSLNAATAQPAPAPALAAKADVARPLVLKGDDRPIYVLLRLQAREEVTRASERPPLNLALVLDRSGSMEEAGKLDYLKEATHRILGQLGSRDVLSIVEYDDRVTVLWPAGPMVSVNLVKGLIDALEPRGSTDLAAGMMAGIAEAKKAASQNIVAGKAVPRVLLLSDGLANHGVTEPRQIAAIARQAKASGVPVSTLGLGRDYDEDLMQAIAESGGGRYYYIESPAQTARIFAQEMNTLFHLAAREISVELKLADGVKDAEILGFDGLSAELGDLAAGESRSLLLRLSPPAQSEGKRRLGMLNVSFTDAKPLNRHAFFVDLDVVVTSDAAAAAKAENAGVAVEAVLAETERGQKEAVGRLEAGDASGAQKHMSQLVQSVEKSQAALKDKRLEKKLEALRIEQGEMAEAALAPAQGSEYLKRTKQRLYQAKMGKRALSQLQEGDQGYEVERLQEALIKAGYYRGPVDGKYSASVTQAVKAFQESEKLGPDGIAGPATMKELGLY